MSDADAATSSSSPPTDHADGWPGWLDGAADPASDGPEWLLTAEAQDGSWQAVDLRSVSVAQYVPPVAAVEPDGDGKSAPARDAVLHLVLDNGTAVSLRGMGVEHARQARDLWARVRDLGRAPKGG